MESGKNFEVAHHPQAEAFYQKQQMDSAKITELKNTINDLVNKQQRPELDTKKREKIETEINNALKEVAEHAAKKLRDWWEWERQWSTDKDKHKKKAVDMARQIINEVEDAVGKYPQVDSVEMLTKAVANVLQKDLRDELSDIIKEATDWKRPEDETRLAA